MVNRQESQNLKTQLEFFEIMKVDDEAARLLKLEEFAKHHSGEDVAYQALMQLGKYNYDNGDLEKAANFYDQVIDSTEGKLMYYLAIDALTPVYIDMGKAAEAADLYFNAAATTSDPNPFLSKFKAANLFELAGNSDKAKEIYEGLIEDEQTPASIKLKAEEQLLWIAVSK